MKVAEKSTLSAKERQRMHNKKYYAENREKELKRVAEYKKQHKDELREKNRQYREKNKDRIKAYRDTPRMKEYQKEYQQMYRAKRKAEAELMKNKNESGEKMQEFIQILLELVKLLDRMLDLDEKELSVCTDTQHRFVVDFRNLLATFASRLQSKEENLEKKKTSEDVALAEHLLIEDADADDDSDGGIELYLKHTRDIELC